MAAGMLRLGRFEPRGLENGLDVMDEREGSKDDPWLLWLTEYW